MANNVKQIEQAVILAGGRGTRLAPFTDTNPKPMVPINGRPFLEYLVELVRDNGVKEVVMLLGYLPEKIMDHFGDGSKFGLKIKYSVTTADTQTGQRLRAAESLLAYHFLLMNCDTYWPLNLQKFLDFHNQTEALVTVLVYNNKDGMTRNNVLVGEDSFVKKYDKSRQEPDLNGVDAGSWIVNKKVFNYFPEHNFAWAEEIQPILAAKNQLRAYCTDIRYYHPDRPERLPAVEKFLEPKKVIFLDRDGVINKSRGVPGNPDYVKNWGEFEFLPGTLEAVRILTQKGYQIYVISNQPGIARGFMTENDLADIHDGMKKAVEGAGGRFSGVYHCPHGWHDGCDCRKPKPGMLIQAAKDHHINLAKSLFIGDDERDAQAGEAAGCKTILIGDGKNLLDVVKSLT